jgi:hypothetical protein
MFYLVPKCSKSVECVRFAISSILIILLSVLPEFGLTIHTVMAQNGFWIVAKSPMHSIAADRGWEVGKSIRVNVLGYT